MHLFLSKTTNRHILPFELYYNEKRNYYLIGTLKISFFPIAWGIAGSGWFKKNFGIRNRLVEQGMLSTIELKLAKIKFQNAFPAGIMYDSTIRNIDLDNWEIVIV